MCDLLLEGRPCGPAHSRTPRWWPRSPGGVSCVGTQVPLSEQPLLIPAGVKWGAGGGGAGTLQSMGCGEFATKVSKCASALPRVHTLVGFSGINCLQWLSKSVGEECCWEVRVGQLSRHSPVLLLPLGGASMLHVQSSP